MSVEPATVNKREFRRTLVTKKGPRRERIVDGIIKALKNEVVYKTIDYRKKSENYIKQYLHRPFIAELKEIHKELAPNLKDQTIGDRAEESLLWEGDKKVKIPNFQFLGVQHRPDFIVQIDGIRVAVEVKRGESGAAVREGLGQALVYAVASEAEFDFVCYLFVDISKDNKVRRAFKREAEQFLMKSLWKNYNIRFDVI